MLAVTGVKLAVCLLLQVWNWQCGCHYRCGIVSVLAVTGVELQVRMDRDA